jgi:hypothetical protein
MFDTPVKTKSVPEGATEPEQGAAVGQVMERGDDVSNMFAVYP